MIAIAGDLGKGGMDFCLTLGATTQGGRVYTLGDRLIVENTEAALLVFSAGTTLVWSAGRLVEARLCAGPALDLELGYAGVTRRVSLKAGETRLLERSFWD
jgi:hypothetical protein